VLNAVIESSLISKLIYPCVLTLLLAISVCASAQIENPDTLESSEHWYQVEFILFEHLQSDRHVLRYEDVKYALPVRDQYQFLVPKGEVLSPFQLEQIDNAEAELNDALHRMKASSEVKVHVDGGWQQAIKRDQKLPPIKIAAGKQYGNRYQLEGELRIRRGRYMHIEIEVFLASFKILPYADLKNWLFEAEAERWPIHWLLTPLAYRHPALLTKGETTIPENTVHFKQSRRIKDGEVHYIDHPALGLIATIKRIDAPFEYGDTEARSSFEN